MNKKPLILVSLCTMVILVLASLGNVVGYHTIQSSQQQTIKETINTREVLFQTIVDIANNKGIQHIILNSQINRGIFPSDTSGLTKNQLQQMYFIGVILTKCISKPKIHSMVQTHQFFTTDMQKEISAIIEKDATITAEITQLQNSKCECENKQTPPLENLPMICLLLFPLFIVGKILIIGYGIFLLDTLMIILGSLLNCFWVISS